MNSPWGHYWFVRRLARVTMDMKNPSRKVW